MKKRDATVHAKRTSVVAIWMHRCQILRRRRYEVPMPPKQFRPYSRIRVCHQRAGVNALTHGKQRQEKRNLATNGRTCRNAKRYANLLL